ncbi:MAG: NAD+ synthase [Gammaproteobacteria bacterium]|nr:NAD+ synthase [Gammaproteobacteria bacterium]
MSAKIKVALAQLNFTVGDVVGNTSKVIAEALRARDEFGADFVLFPELTLTGYPPEDLLFHAGLKRKVADSVRRVVDETTGIAVMFGYPEYSNGDIYNAAALVKDGKFLARYRKRLLPNYSVFDEKRYFKPGDGPVIAKVGGVKVGLAICEDIWEPGPVESTVAAGAQLIFNINASPYSIGVQKRREKVLRARVAATGIPIAHVNYCCGQDELVFDGRSLVMDAGGGIKLLAPVFEEGIFVAEFEVSGGKVQALKSSHMSASENIEEVVYKALVTGTRDYVEKHGFPGVVLGLSGGIDSALTMAIAVDALGADRVRAVMMPSRYTSQASRDDAREQAELLGVKHDVIDIEPMFKSTLQVLAPVFEGLAEDATEENIQSRCRGMILMAISNKTGSMVLTTGNKSEMAVGYATLYGDMAGGFAPIKDCSKSLVFRLARYRNQIAQAIPENVIVKPPSAELRPDQLDSDSLPPYEILDPILEAFIEDDLSVDEIVARGFERETVGRVLALVRIAEYKRRQAPPGIRVSRRAFGRDWRYPITSGYRA